MSALTTMAFVALFIASCGSSEQKSHSKEEKKSESEDPGYATESYDEETPYPSDESSLDENRPSDHIEVKERKLIREGWLTWRADDLAQTKDRVTALTNKHKGYFSVENTYNYSSRLVTNLTVRIPSDKFDSYVEELSQGIAHFERRNINVVDVTGEFIDVESRIKSKKEMEARYLQLLQQARTVTEMLEIERQLGSLREEIESAQARLNGMSDRISYSTLYLEFYTPVESYEYTEDEPGFWSRSGQAFTIGWSRVLNFFIRLFMLWPWLLVITVAIVAFRKQVKRKLQRGKQ